MKVSKGFMKKQVLAVLSAFVFIALNGGAQKADAGRGVSKDYLILANFNNAIPDEYFDDLELTEVSKGYQMEKEAAANMLLMLGAAKKAGLNPVIVSAFRTRAKQESLFFRQIDKQKKNGLTYYAEAYSAARKVVARPGTSEHEMGLAADIVSASYTGLDSRQEKTKEAKWLFENCAEYGFILRYPKNKTSVTEIIYEPWHYRYVGVEAARAITEQGVCLEEYLENLKS